MPFCKCGNELTKLIMDDIAVCEREYKTGKPCEDRPTKKMINDFLDSHSFANVEQEDNDPIQGQINALKFRMDKKDERTHCAGCGTTTWETGECPGVEP